MQRGGAVGRVKREHVGHPAGPVQSLGLLRQETGSGGHHEDVVVQRLPVVEVHAVAGQVDPFHPGHPEGDAVPELPLPPPGEAGHVTPAERDEQEAGLVHMLSVLVDDHDLGGLAGVGPPQPVGGQGPACATTQDHDALHKIIICRAGNRRQSRWSRPRGTISSELGGPACVCSTRTRETASSLGGQADDLHARCGGAARRASGWCAASPARAGARVRLRHYPLRRDPPRACGHVRLGQHAGPGAGCRRHRGDRVPQRDRRR